MTNPLFPTPAPGRAPLQRSTSATAQLLHSQVDKRGVIHLVNFRWLTALRWAAVIGQTLAIAFVHYWMDVPLPLWTLSVIVLAELCVNWLATYRGNTRQTMTEHEIVTFVGLDLVAFTGLLFFTGGPSNPFSFFYIVHVAMGALILSPPFAWSLAVMSVASYAALFSWHVPMQEISSRDVYLQGIWVAYGLGATCIVYFIQRARAEIEEREELLAREADLRLHAERLSSLATLAAGAAHELASPLATIAVVSKELEHELRSAGQDAALQDVQLMRTQVERCRGILSQMAHTAGEAPGEYDTWHPLSTVIDGVVKELPERGRILVVFEEALSLGQLKCPKEALAQSLRVLVDNALDASSDPVELRIASAPGKLLLSVKDSGSGMPPSVLQRVFEPFYTTKAPGKGMGLGLHLARNVVTGLGGALTLDSHPGSGTTARIDLPSERFRLERLQPPGDD